MAMGSCLAPARGALAVFHAAILTPDKCEDLVRVIPRRPGRNAARWPLRGESAEAPERIVEIEADKVDLAYIPRGP
jgi:hypothetical protein